MATLADLYKRVEALDVDDVIEESFADTEEQLAEANRQQLLDGKNSSGNKIGEYASEEYAEEKYALNSRAGFGNKDLTLTGDFSKSINTHAFKDVVVFDAFDMKTEELLADNGEDILGVGGEYKQTYINDELRPALIGNIRQKLKL